jgi:hypothetical protein
LSPIIAVPMPTPRSAATAPAADSGPASAAVPLPTPRSAATVPVADPGRAPPSPCRCCRRADADTARCRHRTRRRPPPRPRAAQPAAPAPGRGHEVCRQQTHEDIHCLRFQVDFRPPVHVRLDVGIFPERDWAILETSLTPVASTNSRES